ncbi:MAG TPA: TonB-dependent receptor [Vicinamibacterales bacterium]|nr:TonB-dependent receptor [Vicinamibacterales bacterium]
MKQIARSVAVALFAIAAIAHPAVAQVTETGTIEVVVQDQGGLPIPGANVVATAVDSVTKREAVTDAEGRALLVGLAPSAQYVVTTELTGFRPARNENVLVRSGQTASLKISLAVGGVTEQVQVTAESPIVDTKSATTGQDITLQLTESLPTGRSYQSYLQLVPGVLPDDPQQPGNPASKSGVNYSDIGGNVGVSSDNFYYFNGINVTDPVTGTFGSNLNTEIIQEQKVLTGGIPAEFVGTPGLLSSVITKSGTNAFHGSGNYFFQNAGLVADNKNSANEEFSTFDAAGTVGGPIIRDKAWFFGSYRRLEREDDVTTLDTQQFMRTVKNEQDQGYAKGTWTPTRSDSISFTFLNDPTDISGRRDRNLTNARDRARVQGGDNYTFNYSRLQGPALIEAAYFMHNGEVTDLSAIREQSNTVVYRSSDSRLLTDEQRGGFGQDLVNQRDTEGVRGSVQYTWNRHTFKGGLEWQRNENYRNTTFLESATLTSLQPGLAGLTASQLSTGSFSAIDFNVNNTSDFGGLLNTINGSPNRAQFYSLYDADGNGTITAAELGSRLAFNTLAANGTLQYDRTLQAELGPQLTKSRGLSFFAQDQFRFDRLTFNVGLRGERWEHFATTGENIFTFDWAIAPRLSAAYDVLGDGRQKAYAYYGRYYDPIRNNMTNFAGTLTGSVLNEQVFFPAPISQWVTYRIRGGAVQQDAFFAPTTKTPYTDDFSTGYQVDLGNNMSAEANYTYRRTRDILEDYDLALFAYATNGTTDYAGPIDDPNSLWLGLDYFGYTQNPGSNFVIATLNGGKRNYQGLDLIFRKRYSNNWQLLGSYTYNWAKGNTNSDSNADFQGDVLFLDPLAPDTYKRQPGLIPHVFKVAGSYMLQIGVELGAAYRWNSGTVASRTATQSGRNLPVQVPAPGYEYAGVLERWVQPDAIGSLQNPSWGQLDLRAQYKYRLNQGFGTEFFVDIFNVFDNQDSIRNQDLVAGSGGIAFGQPIRFNDPRRFFLGARVTF